MSNNFEQFRGESLEYMDNLNRTLLEKWCKEIGCKYPIGYYNNLSDRKMVIYTERPGAMIGYHGKNVNLLKELLKEEFLHEYTIEFVEIRGKIINITQAPKEYWVSAIIQDEGDIKPWLCPMTSPNNSLEDAKKEIQYLKDRYNVISAYIDVYDQNNAKQTIFHECYL